MRNKFILILFFSIYLNSCTNKPESIIEKELKSLNINLNNFNQIDTTKYKNEKIETLRFISSNNEYLDISFYKSGKKKSYGWARKGQVDGKYIDWFENGNLEWTRKYNLGHQIGKSIQYYKNGNKKKVHNNENDAYKTYYKNGILREYFLDTVTITYYLNGQIFQKYNNTGKVEFYNENGKSVFKGKHSNGYLTSQNKKYSGSIICFFQNNDTAYYAKYDNGQLYGKYFGYYGNGNIRFKGSENNNNKENYLTHYYLNGNKRFTRKGDSIINWDKNGKLEK